MTDTLEIYLNDTLEWSRGKRSAHAVHAFLAAHNIFYTHAVRVLNAKPRDFDAEDDSVVFDNELPVARAEKDDNTDALVIHVFSRKSEDRDVTAARAICAASMYYGLDTRTVMFADTFEDDAFSFIIRDAGRTELAPNTFTAASRWI